MAKLAWITRPGYLGDALVGTTTALGVQASNTTDPIETFTYMLTSGTLPAGLTFNQDGTITGTATYDSASDRYFYTKTYEFTVRIVSQDLTVLDGGFTLNLVNNVSSDFLWSVKNTDLGTIPAGQFYSLNLSVNDSTQTSVRYEHISGDLPTGMQVVSAEYPILTSLPTNPAARDNLLYFKNITSDYISSIQPGYFVFGPGIPPGTVVVSTSNVVYGSYDPAYTAIALSNNTTQVIPVGATITFYTPGVLQGVPIIDTNPNTNQTKSYTFTIRCTNGYGQVRDQTFSVTVSDVFASSIFPTTINLGSRFDGTYYSQQLNVTSLNPAATIEWNVQGNVPPGLTLVGSNSVSTLSGYLLPVVVAGSASVEGYDGNQVSGTPVSMGYFVAGNRYRINTLGDLGSLSDWISVGANPRPVTAQDYPGTVELNEEFVAVSAGNIQNTGATAILASSEIVGNTQVYDAYSFDFTPSYESVNYKFVVQAYDGVNYDSQEYILNVVARHTFTVDSNTSVDTSLTSDSDNIHYPVLLNSNVGLPPGRQDSYYAYKFEGIDFDNADITYKLGVVSDTFDSGLFDSLFISGPNSTLKAAPNPIYSNRDPSTDNYDGYSGSFDAFSSSGATSSLPGLTLDPTSGWLYGRITPQSAAYEEYNFSLVLTKQANVATYYEPGAPYYGNGNVVYNSVTVSSQPYQFKLPVFGDINNTIVWDSPGDLGSIVNGSVSDITLLAHSTENRPLVYQLIDRAGIPCRLPQGLKLLPSGDISGRVSFEAFTIDRYSTTFDGGSTTIDREYHFYVEVSTTDGTETSVKDFVLHLDVIDHAPYNDLYLRALPDQRQRDYFQSIISNTEIFDPAILYRATDPWFGKPGYLRMLFLSGLNDQDLAVYQTAMIENHYTKSYQLGPVEVAVVLDANYNIKYEVVYISVLDPELNSQGQGAGLEINLASTIANPYIDAAGNTFQVVYPNNSNNMISRIESLVGYQDQSTLPDWMTSNQLGAGTNKFNPPLGYTRGVVLAYALPGKGRQIAYRLNANGITFGSIDFVVDTYLIDSFLSTNYNYAAGGFDLGVETTFDRTPINLKGVAAQVNYGITNVSFDNINGQSVDYINERGGLDGITNWANGDTLIFVQQEQYPESGPYNGWIRYLNSYVGDTSYVTIPGYLEKTAGASGVNQRAGVWTIQIANGVVTLQFKQEILPNQVVQVARGRHYAQSLVYYNTKIKPGSTVPGYTVYNPSSQSFYNLVLSRKETTFNNGTTKFITYHDTYYTPGSQDKYLSFPQDGVFK